MNEETPAARNPQMPGWAWAVLALIVLALLISAHSEDPAVKQRLRESLAVEQCWKEYERKSLAPEEKRFIAGACEKMEADYRLKHGLNP